MAARDSSAGATREAPGARGHQIDMPGLATPAEAMVHRVSPCHAVLAEPFP
jgi:hypothetical protein